METVVQRGHENAVQALAISSDGQLLASAGKDQSIILWDVKTTRQLRTFSGHNKSINTLVFNEQNSTLISGGDDKVIRVWNIYSGELLQEISLDFWVSSIAVNSLGTQLIVGGGSEKIILIDIESAKFLKEFPARKTQYGVNVAFGKDDETVISGNDNGFVFVYNVTTGLVSDTLRNITASYCGNCLTQISLLDGGRKLLSASKTGPVTLSDLSTDEILSEYGEDSDEYIKIGQSSDYIFAATEEEMFTWNKNGVLISQVKFPGQDIHAVLQMPSSNQVLLAGDDQIISVWNLEENDILKEYRGYLNAINDRGLPFKKSSYWHRGINRYLSIRNTTLISPDGKIAIQGHMGDKVFLWDVNTGRVLSELIGHSKMVVDYVFTADSRYVFTASADRTIKLWKCETGEELRSFEGHMDIVFELAMSEDGKQLVSGSWDGSLIIWDVATGEQNQRIRFENNSPFSLSFAYRDQYLLVGGLGERFELIEIDSGLPVRDYVGHTGIVTSIDNREELILSSSSDGRVKIWDLKTGFQELRLVGHKEGVNHAIFDTYGKYVATASDDGTAKLWSVSLGTELKTFEGHTGAVTSVQLINDDRILVTSSLDGSTRFWDIESSNEIVMHVLFSKNEWLTKSANGYFDATEQVRKEVFFVKGIESYSLDQFFEEFYKPGLLEQSLEVGANVHLDDALKDKLQEFPPPEINVVSPKEGEKLKKNELTAIVKITDQGGGIDEIRLLHNGKRLSVPELVLTEKEKGKKTIYKEIPIQLVSGKNEISVSAFSSERIESEIERRELIFESQADQITCHLVAIGINEYQNPMLNLNYAKNDAEGFVDLISKKGKDLFDDIKIYPVYDKDASKENILNVLDAVSLLAKPEDVFFFYYAGHGSTVDGKFYFIPTENVRLYEGSRLNKEAIYAGEIQEKFMKISALKQLVVLDACNSGGSTQLLATRGAEEEKAFAQLSRSSGVHVLAAAGSQQYATEFEQLGHGLFTYVILEALSGEADGAPKDGKVTIYELKSYIDDRVPEYSVKYKGKPQYPVTYSRGQDFPIVVE
ncbi:MAG: caspase family protein [Reichenbachiella sp.]